MRKPLEILKDYQELLDRLPELISSSGFKDIYIMDKMGLRRDLYYRRKKNPELFSISELEKLLQIISKSEGI